MWYIYRQIPDMVKVSLTPCRSSRSHSGSADVQAIIAYPSGQYGSFTDYEKTKDRPDGIPAWKVSWAWALGVP
jgi:hypothetical protein